MLAHEWYDANFDEELEWTDSVLKTYALNIIIRDLVMRKTTSDFKKLLGYEAKQLSISSPFDTDYGWNIKLEKRVYQ